MIENSRVMMAIALTATALTGTISGCTETGVANTDTANTAGIGVAEQHFTGNYWQWLYVTQDAYAELGPTATFTPFLNSLSGNLAATLNFEASVNVLGEGFNSDNNRLNVSPAYGTGNHLGGGGSSVNSVANRILPIYIENNAVESVSKSKILGPTTAHRRCFLTSVFNDPSYGTFRESTDLVQTMTSGSNWVIKATGHVLAAAGCVDVTTYLGQASWSGAGTIDLGPSGGGKSCFLTAVGGAFLTNDWNDGVIVSVNAAGHWQMKVSAGKTGTAECDI